MDNNQARKLFRQLYDNDPKIRKILSCENVKMKDIYEYAETLGKIKCEIIKEALKHIDLNAANNRNLIFKEVIGEIDGSASLINQLYVPLKSKTYETAGVNIRPKEIKADKNRIGGIITNILNSKESDKIQDLVLMQITQNHMAMVDQAEEANTKLAVTAGLGATVHRTKTNLKPCSWCEERCGVHKMQRDSSGKIVWDSNIFARHDGCTCRIETEIERPDGSYIYKIMKGQNRAKQQQAQQMDNLRSTAIKLGMAPESVKTMGADRLNAKIRKLSKGGS